MQWERAKLRYPVANYKPWARAEFAVKAPGFDWNAYLTAARLDGPARINAYTDAPIVPRPSWSRRCRCPSGAITWRSVPSTRTPASWRRRSPTHGSLPRDGAVGHA